MGQIMIHRRSKDRITKHGILFERKLIALRRLQDQLPKPPGHTPTEQEIESSKDRWDTIKTEVPE